MANLPEYRRKGFKIYDDDGNHIFDLAEDIEPFSPVMARQFTKLSIAEPFSETGIHPAIAKQCKWGHA